MANTFNYSLRRSRRARALRVSVYPDGRLVVSAPLRISLASIERFLEEKSVWIVRSLAHFRSLPERVALPAARGDYARHQERARALAIERLAHWNRFYGFTVRKVSVRNQKTRWGSCSRAGALAFNYRIVLLSPALADYVIVHELCHLGEFSHSRRFWDLVARALPDHRERRRELRRVVF